ncbi:MAG TPA: bacteriohopanetetrol glucosamine biosynthesis glycosyltransferase HpnI [Candidatus Acidoferrum sp.]|nr:bacteriohopanetetrol glucosamine biosynthesis glycosyltransferase HpnI [Candidatus Acidoferrum sp.]
MSKISTLLFVLTMISGLYWVWALACVSAFRRRPAPASQYVPPVSVLKPLQGDDGQLYANLRSFCRQDYPEYEILFGVEDADDPATAIVHRLIREFPCLDISLVIGGPLLGTNRKVSNLAHLCRRARYDTLVLADGDMRVGRDYLGAVVAPLNDPAVGAVTCSYRGSAPAGVWSTLGAMFINEWFLPSVLVAARLEPMRHAFGATIGLRRSTLASIGGFEALADYLADDYMLGRLISGRGLRVVLSSYVVENVVVEPDLRTLFYHELRWTRTVRSVRPVSYSLSAVTHGIPLALLLLLSAGPTPLALSSLLLHLGLRCGGRVLLYRRLNQAVPWPSALLVPVRDVLSFILWALSFLGQDIRWSGRRLRIQADGKLRRALPSELPRPVNAPAEAASLGRK